MRIKSGVEFYAHWKHWVFGKIFRLNSSFMYGYSPYTSYRVGPFELRVYTGKI